MAKTYVGKSESATNKFGGNEIRIGLTKENLEFLFSKLNEKGWVNLTLKTSKEGKPFIEHWEPDGQAATPVGNQRSTEDHGGDDLPF